ncbi:DUF262 domain-containing protein [Mycoplasmopsis felis]|uniref:GmrSD restriction endonuclease domain-containing protein n=1 Tax=Mycoplasmopsis felis TaxID=33923 RepID=UPI002AFE0C6F|nr:DUF262 domain-containing protein [Mycoplasmopsis felis]WQQ04244.1 DUF262 domain-containing protein [Mycoplasmopsis felis]
MKANFQSILKFLKNNNNNYYVPIFQRPYTWEKEQCERLWNDIIILSKGLTKKHFLGTIVNVFRAGKNSFAEGDYLIIDGQQRLTTLVLLLLACIDEYKLDLEQELQFLKDTRKYGDRRYKIILNNIDKDILISLIERSDLSKYQNWRLVENYNLFKKLIKEYALPFETLKECIDRLEICIIEIGHDDTNDPQEVFETINSTGKPLTKTDLIRNNVLIGIQIEAQNYLYQNYWKKIEDLFKDNNFKLRSDSFELFFKDYLTLKLKRIPKNNKIYEEFKHWRLFNKDFIEPELLLKDIYKNAKIYTNFLFLREKDDKLNFFFKQFVELNNTPSFVLLLKVLNDAENKLIDYQTLINILEICISFLVRRKICSIPSSSLNKIFEDLIQKIEDENYEQSINNFLINGKDSREFPDDNKFKQSFIENNFKQKQLPWFILKNIEKFFNKTPINLDLLSLEHILPQNRNLNKEWREVLGSEWKSKQENYLYKIGNLTLTSYNSEMSDKSFDEKKNMKNGFSDSGLRINDSLLNLSKWTEQEIDDRSTWLFNKAIKIWKYPDQQEDIIENSNNNQDNSNILDRYIKTEKTETLYHIINNWFLDQPYEIKPTYNKWYITYKLYYMNKIRSVISIIFEKEYLKIILNMKDKYLKSDELNICEYIGNKGHWGNGDLQFKFKDTSSKEYILKIMQECLDYNLIYIKNKIDD